MIDVAKKYELAVTEAFNQFGRWFYFENDMRIWILHRFASNAIAQDEAFRSEFRIRTEFPPQDRFDVYVVSAKTEKGPPVLISELKYYWDSFNESTFDADIGKLARASGEKFFVVAFKMKPFLVKGMHKKVRAAGAKPIFWVWRANGADSSFPKFELWEE